MTNAINASLASLQSWMLIGDDIFLRQRQAGWSVIDKNHKQLQNYSEHWEATNQKEKLNAVGENLVLFKQQQKAIEGMAHTEEATLAVQALKEKTSPLGHLIIADLRRISDPQNWEMQRIFEEKEKQENVLTYTALTFLVFSVVGGLSLGVLLARAVIMPLNRTIVLADSISKGDYSLEHKLSSGDDKLDVALQEMTKQLYEKSEENKSQQKTLEEYNRLLKASNEELSQFSYRTSHDLRAPLITVRGLADAICEDIGDRDYREAEKNAHNIAGHVRKLEKLVIDILSLAKADLEITAKEAVCVNTVVAEIKTRLDTIYIESDVVIETDIDEELIFYISKVRLTQILENLISNAIKYSDKCKSRKYVKISTMRKRQANFCVVEDNGMGIPEEFRNRVFNMFERFHPNVSYGSGLGLYIIKKHIDNMGGKISFTSSEEGTRFVLEFPDTGEA